ncbi:zinc finger MYM-type protein 1-like [Corticium candelabrum]|nr:zinc finger MYM-type protein 1-like [Corticium candelabrum]
MPRLARKRKASERLEWGRSEPYYPATPKDQFRMTVNELVDTMIMELRERFNENDYDVLTAVETLLADALTETKPNLSLLQTACQFYRSDFDYSRLHHQLTVFYGEIKAIASSHGKRQIESDLPAIQHIRQLFAGKGLRDSYPEVLRLLQIYLVVPVSSAESERSFSTLRRLKTWLRSSMEEERLAALALLTVEREEVLKLEEAIDELIEEFCARGNRRMIFQ